MKPAGAALFAAAVVTAADPFHDSCAPGWKWTFGGIPLAIAATCPDSEGRNHSSWLDLDDCVSNSEGRLVGKERCAPFVTPARIPKMLTVTADA
jgi:hypothetical protein